ncbi:MULTISPECIES: hypothetical protein [Bacillus]|uniref:hypothetical protein n=1 Tax=Bacillus TaxID=1386 RepID=UPI001143C141|nr:MULTISPECIES: hypothetical protein [Bacillus]
MMKKIIVVLSFLFTSFFPNFSFAAMEDYEVVASSKSNQVFLYAQKRNGMYEDIQLVYKGGIISKASWVNVTNHTYAPKIIVEDISGDQLPEIVIVLTKGYGTAVLDQEVHVLQYEKNEMKEVKVADPLSVVANNVKSTILQDTVEITISNKKYIIDISHIPNEHRFENVYFGNIVKFDAENNQLVASLYGQVAPSSSVGQLTISFEYADGIFKVEDINFLEIE